MRAFFRDAVVQKDEYANQYDTCLKAASYGLTKSNATRNRQCECDGPRRHE